jgi:hypothetical protein
MKTPGEGDFRAALRKRLETAGKNDAPHCDVQAGNLHHEVGGYPNSDELIQTCCEVMRQEMRDRDRILEAPGSGVGTLLLVRYMLPHA